MSVAKVALIGNPNTGKTSVFNLLTGLRQHVGNFPGVTVDKRWGTTTLVNGTNVRVLDLPGTYSIFPKSADEQVVYNVITDSSHPEFPDLFLVVADASNLERNLLLFSQLYDLNLPVLLVLTMEDLAVAKGQTDVNKLSAAFDQIPVVWVNGRTGKGLKELKECIANYKPKNVRKPFVERDLTRIKSDVALQTKDAEQRLSQLAALLKRAGTERISFRSSTTKRIDRLLVHPFWGYFIFGFVLFVIFQIIYRIAAFPMDWIDGSFLELSLWAKTLLPPGVFTDLLAEGIVPGIGGVLVFVPQIALLFLLLSLLEETGYMARVVFIMDKLVRPFGLSGKSVVPLMSSVACAIPGIMATRTINSWKDRLITIMVAPLMSCSARIPVYTLMIALVIPEGKLLGFIDQKGLVLFMLYALGLISALLIAAVIKLFVKTNEPGFLIMEMPEYRAPRWSAVALHVFEKVRVFVVDAGKVILAISIVLWGLASYGPSERIENAVVSFHNSEAATSGSEEWVQEREAAIKLENSYIGILGKVIEPVIRPLGYDWKIGIAIITSFAAREVFVGSMATIYSVGKDEEDIDRLQNTLLKERHPHTGEPVYTLASGASLMVFYAFAMQCMATFAVVKRETKSWKWPIIQLTYMGVLAYLAAWFTFVLLS